MAASKPVKLTARERYAELAAKHAEAMAEKLEKILAAPLAENEPTFQHTTPSGMEWTLRRPKPHLFVNAGLLPAELALKAAVMTKEGVTGPAMLDKISGKELAQTIELNSAIVRYICVDPRIVETPTADDEIGFDDVLREDYADLLAWANNGGGEADRLGNFPRK